MSKIRIEGFYENEDYFTVEIFCDGNKIGGFESEIIPKVGEYLYIPYHGGYYKIMDIIYDVFDQCGRTIYGEYGKERVIKESNKITKNVKMIVIEENPYCKKENRNE